MHKRFYSTKTYTHATGLSCAFRQWRAESHCRFLHGYALEIRLTFEAQDLDERGWVVDFGSLKSLKGMLEDALDHKTLVAEDDPHLAHFHELEALGIVQLRILPAVGCEALAGYILGATDGWLFSNGYAPRVTIKAVEVREHAGNSAIAENVQ